MYGGNDSDQGSYGPVGPVAGPPSLFSCPENQGSGAPTTQILETGGPTILDIAAIADGDILVRDGNEVKGSASSLFRSPLTTKGDLFVFGSENTRLPVGDDGQILIADSGEALGVRWATGSGTTDPTAWHNGGDSFGSEKKLGTMDEQDLVLYSRGDACMRFNFNGNHLQGGPLLNGCVTTNMDEGIDIPFRARYRAYVDSGDNAFTGMGMGTLERPNTVFFGGFEGGTGFRRADTLSFWASDNIQTSTPVEVMIIKEGYIAPPSDSQSNLGKIDNRWNTLWLGGHAMVNAALNVGNQPIETVAGSAIFGRTGHEKLHFHGGISEVLLELSGDAGKYTVLHLESEGDGFGTQIRMRNKQNVDSNIIWADNNFGNSYIGKDDYLTISAPAGKGVRCNVNATNDNGWEVDKTSGEMLIQKPKFGTHAALGGETVTGYITIKDAGGISRKLAVVS